MTNEIQKIFTSDKSDWFIETDNNLRIWNAELVHTFWSLVRTHKIEKDDYYFENFVFPSFSKNGLAQLSVSQNYFVEVFSNEQKIIDKPVSFINCRFLGDTYFLGEMPHIIPYPKANINFVNNLKFENCRFDQEFRFQSQKVNGDFVISNCNFYGETVINSCTFGSRLSINYCHFNNRFLYHGNFHSKIASMGSNVFEKLVQMNLNIFEDSFSINTAEFNNKIGFESNTYKAYSYIVDVHLNHQSSFKNENYRNFSFQDIDFSSKNHLFENISLNNDDFLLFRNLTFPKTAIIRNSDCNKIKFLDSDPSEVKFSSCNWDLGERLVILDEKELKNYDNLSELKNLEHLYRQLKKNFENDKDWELAGKTYVSEMLFRKLRLYKEKNYFSWFIYWFYDFFGGYTQNYIRPIIWFCVFTTIIFPLYYLFFECHCNYNSIFIKSFAASIPLLKTDLQYSNWWIHSFQSIISTILMTFFILALRKRFKQ